LIIPAAKIHFYYETAKLSGDLKWGYRRFYFFKVFILDDWKFSSIFVAQYNCKRYDFI